MGLTLHLRECLMSDSVLKNKEILSLLYWTMLAAGTVGPGTVVTCARAGVEFELNLIWALIFASLLNFILQEGTVRLTIISGKSLGQCLQDKYKHGRLFWRVGIICWLVAGSIFVGNTLFECNNFAGGMSAVYSLPGASNTHALRIGCCFAYGVIVLALLFADKVDSLGIGLGLVMVGMVVLFLVVVTKLGIDGVRFAKGLVPISMPRGSGNVVLSLVGTTAVGVNLFLGGEMARGKTLPSAQRGIAFSTIMTFIVSVLILIVGDGIHNESQGVFTIASLAGIVTRLTGTVGIWIFGLGFIAAALSSMLTAPLSAALTADSVFAIKNDTDTMNAHYGSYKQMDQGVESNQDKRTDQSSDVNFLPEKAVERPFPKKFYNGLMFIMVTIAVIVISADAPVVLIIMIAQVINGCLLPFFSICLLICLNDAKFMKNAPQRGWANCFLIAGVTLTLFLTVNTIIQNFFGWLVSKGHASESTFEIVKFSTAGVGAIIIMILLFLVTDLGKRVKKSFSNKISESE